MRLDPKLKYLAELAARRQRRPLSSYIEWAIERSLSGVEPSSEYSGYGQPTSFADVASELWDVDGPDRFAKLALKYPDLLDHDEQRIWKLIRECGYLWKGRHEGSNQEWKWSVHEDTLVWERLRRDWTTLCRVADGELEKSALPDRDEAIPMQQPEIDDDEIPF